MRMTDRQVFVHDYHYFRTCSGKTRHANEKAARNHLKQIRNAELRPYKCPFCEWWHVGHPRNAKENQS
jgi:hypothetical protein